MDMYQFFAPIFKTHPWLSSALFVAMIISAIWSKTAPRFKERLHRVPYVGIRLAGVLDLLVALTPTAPKIFDAAVKGVVLGQVKPSAMSAAQLQDFAARVLATGSVPPSAGGASATAPRVIISESSAPSDGSGTVEP